MIEKLSRFAFGLLSSALIWVTGCGGSDLTGGSVPIGNPGPTRLIGTVVDEEEPTVPLADAEVEISLEDGTKIVKKTDTSGMFSAELPRDTRFTLKVRPPVGFEAIYHELVGDFVSDADEIRIVLPIPRKGAVMPSFAELKILPEKVTLQVHDKVQFHLQLTPPPQRPVRPVWSVHGGVGTITADGLFVATRPGSGVVRVRFGNLRAQAVVVVLKD